MDPRPIWSTQKDLFCQLGAEDTPIVCISTTRSNYLHSKLLYSLAPEIDVRGGKIALKKRPGDYYHPEYDGLDGLTPLEAAQALPEIQKRIGARIDNAANPAKKTPASD